MSLQAPLRLRGIGRDFGPRRVLRDLHLDVAPGETVAITGRSGAGKSTLLRIIAGLDGDHDGTVRGAGRIAMVFQEPRLLPWRSALANVMLATRAGEAVVLDLFAQVGLQDHAHAHPPQMSLGQQRRLALVRAAALEADTLLLDEPFASLDERTAREVRDALHRLVRRSGSTVLIATHDRADVEALCDRALHLDGGALREVA